MKKEISITGMSCEHCKKRVENALSELNEVNSAKVDLKKALAIIECDEKLDDSTIKNTISKLGFEVNDIRIKKGLFGK